MQFKKKKKNRFKQIKINSFKISCDVIMTSHHQRRAYNTMDSPVVSVDDFAAEQKYVFPPN